MVIKIRINIDNHKIYPHQKVIEISDDLQEKVLQLNYAFCEEDSEIPNTNKDILEIIEEIEKICREIKFSYKAT